MSTFHFGGDSLSQSLDCHLSSMLVCLVSSLKIKLDEVQVRAFKVKNKCYVACISHIFMRFLSIFVST